MTYYSSRRKRRPGRVLFEIRRYLKHPFCLVKHRDRDPFEIGTDGRTLDYYCDRCQKVIKSVPVKSNIDFFRFKKYLEEEGEWGLLDDDAGSE